MLTHLNSSKKIPSRVVVLGAHGFVGSTSVNCLLKNKIPVVALGRNEIDLLAKDASNKLTKILQPEDVLVITSAKAPCKNYSMLGDNINMLSPICEALVNQPVAQVIYISSDAVYADANGKLNEACATAPASLHGVMHLARELMLQSVVEAKSLAILRPSLLYGAQDPHNGYGPNQFYRLAAAQKVISLFGGGEEQRDHVYIEDVANIIYLCLVHRSYGIVNIATGDLSSFYEIAQQIKQLFDHPVEIKMQPRKGPMPHNGYRAFDITACQHAFPEFQYTALKQGLLQMHQHHCAQLV